MNVLEGNKLIAEFMGGKFNSEWRFLDNPENPIQPSWVFQIPPTIHSCSNWGTEQLEYHSNWSWLMPVIEKIENLEVNNFFYEVLIANKYCSINLKAEKDWMFVSTTALESTSKIDAVWQTIIKFLSNHV